jgi:hypothetical protein
MPRGKHNPYAHLCTDCGHLGSRHGLVSGGDVRAGPYRCADCGCEQTQDGPFEPLTRRQYETMFGGDDE